MLDKLKNSFELQLNFKYCLLLGFYWILYCCIISFASAYLAGLGFSTASIGALLALVYLISTFVQQVVSDYADKSKTLSVLDISLIVLLLVFVSEVCLCVSFAKNFGTGFWFLISGIGIVVLMPLLNAVNFYLEKTDVEMNYGIARSFGSFFFFISSLLVGTLLNSVSMKSSCVISVIVVILAICDVFIIRYDVKGKIFNEGSYDPFLGAENNGGIDIKYFIEKYKMFFVFLIGVVCFYYGHVLINNFFYQIVINVGGNAADDGGVLALQAIVELPCMIFFNRLKEIFGTKRLLGASAIFFLIKMFFTTIATSMGMIYLSVLFQSVSFALFIPASVHLVDEIMSKDDAVKGQSFVTVAMTIANLLASLFGGIFIQLIGVRATLVIGTIITLIGVFVAIFGLIRINSKKFIY